MVNYRSALAAAALAFLALSPVGTSAPSTRLVIVEPHVKLEVLDWGGTGRSTRIRRTFCER
jgi:hypothetical protein